MARMTRMAATLGVVLLLGAGITCGGCQPTLRQMLAERGHPCPRAESLRTLRAHLDTEPAAV